MRAGLWPGGLRGPLVGWLYLSVAAIGGLVSGATVLQNLDRSSAGVFFLAQGYLAFVLLFDVGLYVTGVREIAFAFARPVSGSAGRRALVVASRFANARSFGVLALLVAAILVGGSLALVEGARWREQLAALLISCLVGIPSLIAFNHQAALEGTGRYHLDRLSATAGTALNSGVISVAALASHDLLVVSACWIGAVIAVSVLKFSVLRASVPRASFIGRPSIRDLRSALRRSRSIFAVQLGGVLTKAVQFPIVSVTQGVAEIGPYIFAVRIAGTIDSAIAVLGGAQRATFAHHISGGRLPEARTLALTTVGLVGVLAAIAFLLFGFALPALSRRFAPDLPLDGAPFLIIAADMAILCVAGTMSLFVIASGRNPFARIVLLNGAVSILAVSALTPRFGIAGAATGQMLATLFVSGWFNSLEFAKTIRGLKRGADGGGI